MKVLKLINVGIIASMSLFLGANVVLAQDATATVSMDLDTSSCPFVVTPTSTEDARSKLREYDVETQMNNMFRNQGESELYYADTASDFDSMMGISEGSSSQTQILETQSKMGFYGQTLRCVWTQALIYATKPTSQKGISQTTMLEAQYLYDQLYTGTFASTEQILQYQKDVKHVIDQMVRDVN